MLLRAKVEGGIIEGSVGWDQKVSVFKGVPYAAPPIGELRWKEPQPVVPWEGILQCKDFGAVCTQDPRTVESLDLIKMDEDCLYMNIYTTAKQPGEKRPVLFWIHGGGRVGGGGHSNRYDGEAFAKKGIVVVNFNYRVNVFGFMCHPELREESPHDATGNYGCLDQIAALKWVKNNIEAFGGDPDNITVMGVSGGAGSARFLGASPLTEGLITRLGTMSTGGHGYVIWNSGCPKMEDLYIDLKEAFGVDTIEEARKIEAWELYTKYTDYSRRCGYKTELVVDNYAMPAHFQDRYEQGKHHDIQYLLGATKEEMPAFRIPEKEEMIKLAHEIYGEEAENFLNNYLCINDDEKYLDIIKRNSAIAARANVLGFAHLQNDLGRTPAYIYQFDRATPAEPKGAYHGFDLYYTFKSLDKYEKKFEGCDYELAEVYSEMWTNFIKNGNPNGPGCPLWLPYTEETPYTMIIDKVSGMQYPEEEPIVNFFVEYTRKKFNEYHSK